MIPGLPKVNGAVGAVVKVIGAMITGPAKIDDIKKDIDHIKEDIDTLAEMITVIRVDVGEIKGHIKGHVESHDHPRLAD